MSKIMKSLRKLTVFMALLALLLLSPGWQGNSFASPSSRTLHIYNAEKRVDITVVIHGKIDGYTVQSIEQLVGQWLEVAHIAVVNADGADILELHITVNVDDNDDDDDGVPDSQDADGDGDGDGKGWHIQTECGDWEEAKDADTLDAIDDLLHAMISDFIEKYVH